MAQAEVLMVGGPADGQIVPLLGLFVEVPNPDKSIYGPYDNLIYQYLHDEDGLVTAYYHEVLTRG